MRSIAMSMSVCLSVSLCLSVHQDISGAIFTKFFVRVAFVCGSVLLLHVYNRPHRLSPGKVFFPIENALSVGKEGWECTARAKYAIYAIYDCLVNIVA